MLSFLLERADIYIYAVDMSGLREELLGKQGKLIRDVCSLYVSLIRQRGGQLR